MNITLNAFKKESEKKKAVIDNLRYHKLCLQTVPKHSKLLTITKNGTAKPLDELVENLSALVTMSKRDINEDSDENDDY
uniref:Uncharacterized protein n=1 Tax=Panagrolaimus sp. ES5 TaxID=591445 RepID=A0AC34GL12_9BILA